MAKEDFCFTYYDGDAARDKAHMTRLCRGGYDDLISMQRKVGHMDLDVIKMVLSSDFDACWKSLQFILKQDNEGKYFIEWVDKSIEKMKINAQKNKKKIDEYWQGVKDGTILRNNKSIQQYKKKDTNVIPLENENEDENGIEDLEKGVQGEKPFGAVMQQKFIEVNPGYPQRPGQDIPAMVEFANIICQEQGFTNDFFNITTQEKNTILHEWGRVAEWYRDFGNNRSLDTLSRFKLQEIISELKNGKKNGTKKNYGGSNGSGGKLSSTAVIEPGKAFNTVL